jgi:RecX, first three-helix domain
MATSSPAGAPLGTLEPDPRTEGAVRLVVGGRPLLTVPIEVVTSLGLRSGAALSGEQVTHLELAADREAAYRTAIRLLGRRSFARADLARRLKLKGHLEPAVESALDRAQEHGYLDDARFV